MSEDKAKASFLSLLTAGMWSSRLSAVGVVLTTVSAIIIIGSVILNVMGTVTSPYQGLVSYMVMPAIFILGVLLIPAGAYLARVDLRRRGLSDDPVALKIDLGNPAQRRFWGMILVLTVVNVLIIASASYQGYHYTESTEFCGTLCHTVMQPEYTAYNRSPHARVGCVQCHIGGGASWFVKSKMSGLRQVWAVAMGTYSTPIPTPIENLRPARETCEECHWPEVFHGKRTKTFSKMVDDENPLDPQISTVVLNVGGLDARTGDYHGIHWHVSKQNRVEYRSDPKRENIREVRVTRPDGTVDDYVKEDLPALPPDTPWRTMDCLDCHNRPTHIYETAEAAIDRLILQAPSWATVPGIKPLLVEAVTQDYTDEESARRGIVDYLTNNYTRQHPENADEHRLQLIAAADSAYRNAWALNVFPKMNVTWGTYPNHLGHRNDGGCFRCHSEEHNTSSGKTISQDCDSCHTILVDEERASEISDDLKPFLD
jgi:hypothetical protein